MRRTGPSCRVHAHNWEKTLAIYPIRVPVKPYGGADPKRRSKQSDLHRMAGELADFVNATVRASDGD